MRLGRDGNALLMVLAFAGILAVTTPILMNHFQTNAQMMAYSRDLMIKSLNFDSTGNFSLSPGAIYRSYEMATIAAVDPEINLCLGRCLGKHNTGGGGEKQNLCDNATYGVAGSVHACVSRTTSGEPVWHRLTVYHPLYGDRPLSGPDPNDTGTAEASRKSIRYTLDGALCDTSMADELCPFLVDTYFFPICAGDVYAGQGPQMGSVTPEKFEVRVAKHIPENAPPLPVPRQVVDAAVAVAAAPAPAKELRLEDLMKEILPEAHALPSCPVCGIEFFPCDSTPSAPWTQCPNDPCLMYNSTVPNSINVCCYGTANCGQTSSVTSTNTSTEVNTGSGIGTGTGTGASWMVATCSMAEYLMFWHRITWNSAGGWSTKRRFAGLKEMDSMYYAGDPRGTQKMAHEIPQMKVCGGIFSSIFQPANATCP